MASPSVRDTPKTVYLWNSPRSLSCAFEKCVAFMEGSQVWHEPYTSSYNNAPEIDDRFSDQATIFRKQVESTVGRAMGTGHPYIGGNLIPAETFTHGWVKEQLEKPLPDGATFRFVKDSAFSIDGRYDELPQLPIKYTFLIRHPYRTAPSFRRMLADAFGENPNDFDLNDNALTAAWKNRSSDPLLGLWGHVRENLDPNPVVIDADDLQKSPEKILRKYCEAVGIPFKESYLAWDGSDEVVKYFHGALETVIWGREGLGYKNAFLSSDFQPPSDEIPKTVPAKCEEYAAGLMEGYKVMYETRIKPE